MKQVSLSTYELAKSKGFFAAINIPPYQHEIVDWLRKEHYIYIIIIPTICCQWAYKILNISAHTGTFIETPPYTDVSRYDYNTYEEATEYAILEVLQNLN